MNLALDGGDNLTYIAPTITTYVQLQRRSLFYAMGAFDPECECCCREAGCAQKLLTGADRAHGDDVWRHDRGTDGVTAGPHAGGPSGIHATVVNVGLEFAATAGQDSRPQLANHCNSNARTNGRRPTVQMEPYQRCADERGRRGDYEQQHRRED